MLWRHIRATRLTAQVDRMNGAKISSAQILLGHNALANFGLLAGLVT